MQRIQDRPRDGPRDFAEPPESLSGGWPRASALSAMRRAKETRSSFRRSSPAGVAAESQAVEAIDRLLHWQEVASQAGSGAADVVLSKSCRAVPPAGLARRWSPPCPRYGTWRPCRGSRSLGSRYPRGGGADGDARDHMSLLVTPRCSEAWPWGSSLALVAGGYRATGVRRGCGLSSRTPAIWELDGGDLAADLTVGVLGRVDVDVQTVALHRVQARMN